jgi:predicted dienelactone hydrolase
VLAQAASFNRALFRFTYGQPGLSFHFPNLAIAVGASLASQKLLSQQLIEVECLRYRCLQNPEKVRDDDLGVHKLLPSPSAHTYRRSYPHRLTPICFTPHPQGSRSSHPPVKQSPSCPLKATILPFKQ